MKYKAKKWKIASGIIMIMILVIPIAAQTKELTFRGIPFNSPPEAFIEKLGEPDEKIVKGEMRMLGDEVIIYKNLKVAGYSAETQIEFEKGVYLGGAYLLKIEQGYTATEKTRNYINAYNDLLDKLAELYGEPKTETPLLRLGTTPISALYAAEIAAHAPYSNSWTFDNGKVRLILNYEAKSSTWTLSILYSSESLMEKLQKLSDEKKKDTEGL